MSEMSLREHEREVEEARAKLVGSLATLRSPETVTSFTDDLKREALDTKDVLIEKAKASAQSTVAGVIEDWKAKAAANPAATLAIGAGLAWRLIHNPPIASALVGLGIFSLWRTKSPPPGSYRPDFLAQSRQRLKEQAQGALSIAKDVADQGQQMVSAKAADLSEAAQDKARRWSHDLRDTVSEMRSSPPATEQIESPTESPIRDYSQRVAARTGELLDTATSATKEAFADREARDKILLGVAGVAVAAALGIACQKRLSEDA